MVPPSLVPFPVCPIWQAVSSSWTRATGQGIDGWTDASFYAFVLLCTGVLTTATVFYL